MVDATQKDLNQDEEIAELRKRLDGLSSTVTALLSSNTKLADEITKLTAAIDLAGGRISALERVTKRSVK
jgi:chaperonin cofactor prefoldin